MLNYILLKILFENFWRNIIENFYKTALDFYKIIRKLFSRIVFVNQTNSSIEPSLPYITRV